MNDFLRKIKLIDETIIELLVSKIDFTKKFRENVEQSDLSFDFFESFEALSSSKYEYKGNIDTSGFQIKKKKKLFDSKFTLATAKGRFVENTEKLILQIEINAFKKRMILFLGFILFFYTIFLISMLFSDAGGFSFFLIPFLMLHASLMIGIPYFVLRRSVKRMVYDMERDFHYWVTKI
jgi:hypothetical protein